MARNDDSIFPIVVLIMGCLTFIAIVLTTLMVAMNIVGIIDKTWTGVFTPLVIMMSLDAGAFIAWLSVGFSINGISELWHRLR